MGVYTIGVAGESFRNDDGSSRQDEIRRSKVGESVSLVRDPENPHDDLCVRVISARGVQIGNIPRSASWIAERLDGERYVEATILSIGNGDAGQFGVVLEVSTDGPGTVVTAPKPEKQSAWAKIADAASPDAPKATTKETLQGCLGLIVIIILGALIFDCGGDSAETKAATAEEKRKGFHCLSAFDGSSRQLVALLKPMLRDPDSFEHDETRIAPNKDGKHFVTMRYRAKNGFGGMNVGMATGEIDHETCDAALLSTGND